MQRMFLSKSGFLANQKVGHTAIVLKEGKAFLYVVTPQGTTEHEFGEVQMSDLITKTQKAAGEEQRILHALIMGIFKEDRRR